MSLIKVTNASFSYGNGDIFTDVSFEVKRGEIFCMLGPNGSGKTTLLDCLLGINRLKEGRIEIDGTDITSLDPSSLAKQISYVPQRHECTFPYSVIDITMMGRAPYTGIFTAPTTNDRAIAENALKLTGIFHLKDRPYTKLSGGELQLVMLARAIAQETGVIVMDEPTAHLDFGHELIILETIINLVREKSVSVLMATHFPNHLFYFEDNKMDVTVALLKDRGFMAVGAPREILDEERIESLYGVKASLFFLNDNGNKNLRRIIPIKTVRR